MIPIRVVVELIKANGGQDSNDARNPAVFISALQYQSNNHLPITNNHYSIPTRREVSIFTLLAFHRALGVRDSCCRLRPSFAPEQSP
jgi:hypothetical protein